MDAQLYEYSENHQMEHFKRVNVMVCELNSSVKLFFSLKIFLNMFILDQEEGRERGRETLM